MSLYLDIEKIKLLNMCLGLNHFKFFLLRSKVTIGLMYTALSYERDDFLTKINQKYIGYEVLYGNKKFKIKNISKMCYLTIYNSDDNRTEILYFENPMVKCI